MSEAVLDRARAGDQQAFRELTDPFGAELQLHCYRMLGSLTDAEDVLQETLLAAWRSLHSLSDPGALRAWLYRIATNRSLNALRAAKSRRPPEPVPPFDPTEPTVRSEITWLQPYPDALLEQVGRDRTRTGRAVRREGDRAPGVHRRAATPPAAAGGGAGPS
jgi:RNA polymerase sigma-70 factor (ECF subfamily)